MSKPAHRGRVLVSSRLQPLSTQQPPPPLSGRRGSNPTSAPQPPISSSSSSIPHRRGSGSKSAEGNNVQSGRRSSELLLTKGSVSSGGSLMAAGTSALKEGMGKEKLQRLATELELENQKLRNQLEKAELSVESYRGFLSVKSSSRGHSTSTQTDYVSESKSPTKISPVKKSQQIALLNKKLEDYDRKVLELEVEISSSSQRTNELENENMSLRNQLTSFKMNTEIAEVSYKAQISTLEKELKTRATAGGGKKGLSSLASKDNTPVKIMNKRESDVLIATPPPSSVKKIAVNMHTPSSTSKQMTSEFSPVIGSTSSLKKLKHIPSNISPSCHSGTKLPLEINIFPVPGGLKASPTKWTTSQQGPNSPATSTPTKNMTSPLSHEHKSMLFSIKERIVSHNRDHLSHASKVVQDINDFNEFFSQCSNDILMKVANYERNRNIKNEEHTKEISSLQSELSLAKSNANESSDRMSALVKLENDLSAAKEALEKEKERNESLVMMNEASSNDKDANISNLSTLFTSVSREIQNLENKVKVETAAVKHVGHCRDLVRVASLREVKLDRDRAVSELKFTRDIQNVLAFCLETAEKALSESQPEVVAKLHQSRRKRTLFLEDEVVRRRRDLDQRSAETCAVSSTHLEAFEEKSVIKHKKAVEDTQALFAEIQNILNIRANYLNQ